MSFEYQKAEIPVADPKACSSVHEAIEGSFASARVKDFLKAIDRAGLRIRDFEAVLRKGILGGPAAAEYSRLGNGDQGQIREFYLARLEKVPSDLRAKFFRLYAYY